MEEIIKDIPDEVYRAFGAVTPKIDYSINPETMLPNVSFSKQWPQVARHLISNYRRHEASWKILFEYHNLYSDKKYSTHCMPCYSKVYLFVRSRIMQRG